MKNTNIITKVLQVLLKRNNTTAIRRTLCYAAVLLGIAALLIGCPDSAGDGNSDNNGTPTEATLVQNARSSAIGINTITLNWDAPIDIDGLLGVTISEESNAGNLSSAVAIEAEITTYEVTGLSAGTTYTFTITTRYVASGKDNDTTVPATTITATGIQNVSIDDDATTSDSVTITWADPEDTDDYTGVMIRVVSSVDSFTATETVPDADTDTVTISGLTAGAAQTLTLTFVTQYSTDKGSMIERTIDITTQSNLVTNVVASNTDTTTITLSWADPEDRVRYSGVMVTGSTMAGVMITPQTVSASDGSTAQQVAIMGLTADTDYTFTLATQYADDDAGNRKTGGSFVVPTRTRNPIDVDGDGLVDINSLERLDNVRYNLDLGDASDDGRYKESTQTAVNAGTQCGHNGATPCTGYELTRSLDFADSSSYEGGSVNTEWRPNASDPDTATNAGWDPIGDCQNDDVADGGTDICGDTDDILFASRFEGNGFTISNLYARNTNAAVAAATALFAITGNTSTIHSLGIVDVALYGSNAAVDYVGALVGLHNGIITASYVHNSIVDGGDGSDNYVGGLVGRSNGNITASYAHNSISNGGMGRTDYVGGLVGRNNDTGTITASYTNNSIANGSAGGDDYVGGLVGRSDGTITASYASGSMVDGGDNKTDRVGGLVGTNTGTITASYASGTASSTVSGGANNEDRVGGLVGDNSDTTSIIIASYATITADGGSGNIDRVGSLVGRTTASFSGLSDTNGTITASYGFGTVQNVGIAGTSSSGDLPSGVTMAAQLTAPGTAVATAVSTQWDNNAQNTQDAWHFGTPTQSPALQYADYDGADNAYGCGNTTGTIATIPNMIPTPNGSIAVTCGSTLLPGQQ